jgi:hypothetical protein
MPIQIYLNSSYATKKLNDSKNSDMIFYFTSPVAPPPNHNMTLKVLNITVPVSYTLVNDSNNTLIVNDSTYTLTNGNYNATTLKTHLSSILTGYTVTFSSITNKFTITHSTTNFTISSSSTCQKLLGFPSDQAVSSTSLTLTSTYPIDLSGDNVMYIDIANLVTMNLSSSSGNRTSIVKSVLLNVPYGSVLYNEDTTGMEGVVIQEDHIGFLHVRLFGEDATTLLDLYNSNWQMTVEIGFVQKSNQPTLVNSFQDIFRQYIDRLSNEQRAKP